MAWHDEHMMMHAWERDVRCCSKTTPKGFEPLRAEPNGFLVHHLSHNGGLARLKSRAPVDNKPQQYSGTIQWATCIKYIPGHLLQPALTTGLLRPPRNCRPRKATRGACLGTCYAAPRHVASCDHSGCCHGLSKAVGSEPTPLRTGA